MAQLVEQRPYKAKVGSSSLSGSTATPRAGETARRVGQGGGMNTRSLPLTLTALLATASLAACTTESTPPGAASNPTAEAVTTVEDTAAVLTVPDHTSEGPTVLVEAAALTEGGFVVVASDEGRNVLGTGVVPAGTEAAPVQVSIAEEITEETELVAQLYTDENGSGLYDAGDRPVSNGEDDEDDDAEVFAGEREVVPATAKPVTTG